MEKIICKFGLDIFSLFLEHLPPFNTIISVDINFTMANKPNIFGDVSILCNCAEAAAKKDTKDETVQY